MTRTMRTAVALLGTLLAAGTLSTSWPATVGAVPKPPPPSSNCSHPLTVRIENLPPGAKPSVVLVGPDGYRQASNGSGPVCPPSSGRYAVIALPVFFRNPLGRLWRAYPSLPSGAVPGERVGVVVSTALVPTPALVDISYVDQAPLTTYVVPRADVVVPLGRALPAAGGFQLRKLAYTRSIKPGDVVVAPVGPGLPHGLLGTVTAAQPLVDGVSLHTVAVSPMRAFSQGRLVVSRARVTPAVRGLDGLDAYRAQVLGRRLSPSDDVGFGCGQSFAVSGSASFQPGASLNLGWSWGPWYAPWQVEVTGSFSLSPGVSGSLTVSSTSGINCHVSVDLAKVPIGSVCTEFGCFTFNLLATASLGGTVGEKFSQTLTESVTGNVGAVFDFGYDGNNFSGANNLVITGGSTTSAAWEGSVDLGVGPALQVLYGIPDVAGVGPQVGVQDQLSLNADQTGFDVQAGADASVGIAMSALGFSYSDSVQAALPGSPVTLVPETKWSSLLPDPSPPMELSAAPGATNTELDVNWQPPLWGGCGVTGYTVSAPGAAPVSTQGTSATLTGLSAGTQYTVTVQVVTGCAATSQATVTATTAPPAPPPAPILASVSTAGGWGRPAGWATFSPGTCAQGTTCAQTTGYVVDWSGDGTTGTLAIPGSPDGFDLPAYGTAYTVTISATGSAGTGQPSNPVTFIPTSPPSVPLGVTVTAGEVVTGGYDGPGATITWAPPASDGGLPVTQYRIGWTGGQFDQPASDGTSAFVELPAYGATYSFLVIAFNNLGNGPASTPIKARALSSPGAPGNVSASEAGGTTLDVAWSPPSSDGGTPVTAYEVDWGGQGTWGAAVEPASASTASVQVPVQGVYEVSVLAINTKGDGPPSSPACVTVGVSAPCAPTITKVSAGLLRAAVTWSPPARSGSSPVTSYTLDWTGPDPASSGSLVQLASAGTTAALTPSAQGQYSVTVSATNSTGTGPSSAPSTFTFQLPKPKPCPTGLVGNCPLA